MLNTTIDEESIAAAHMMDTPVTMAQAKSPSIEDIPESVGLDDKKQSFIRVENRDSAR